MEFTTDNSIFLFAILLVVGVITTKFSSRFGLPSLVLFIVVGMVLSHFVYFDNAFLTQLFGILALIVILFEGGLQTKWTDVRKVAVPSLTLATLGVVLTTVVVGVFAKYILGVSWLEGFLFGAIVGSTDAAAVFAVLGSKNIKRRLTSTLEAESGTNDPMAVFLTISLIQLIQAPESNNAFTLVIGFLWQMGLGLLMGLVMGRLAVWSINRVNLDSSGLYPVFALAFAIFTYSSTALLYGSGLLAVYVMALWMGNSDLTYRHSIFRFNEGFAWMMQILMFIILGLLVFPAELIHVTWQGIALSVLLMFVARPIGVFVSTSFMKFSVKEKVFISWAGLRGAVPIVLATYPLIAGLENGQMFFDVVFFVVLISALVQGSTISPLANKLGLSGGDKVSVPHSLELVSMGKTNSEIIEVKIEEGAYVVGRELRLLLLPDDTLVTAVIRGDKLITPRGNTKLCVGDILYVLISKSQRERVKQVFMTKRETDDDETLQA
ncbi:potassium/proton antiporter [Ammoniphilus sp. YIM 78166]|uniref:potassium/proton antiporter n=1 Tax=Ammoniphilus sp. YIM 78166 TaxID=1644106 RepID=UPI00106FEBFF|nr:potassium/proton antiporter [Ammoniphilus sp. YIM 78166]